MTLMDTFVTIGVLLGLFILAYCRLTKKTMIDLFHELKDGLQPETEEYRL